MSQKYVIINADDLGLSEGVNVAVAQAHREGVLTSASLMANGTAFEHAVETVIRQNPGLGVGLHLCLTSGRSVLPARMIPELVDGSGKFRHGFLSLYRALRRRPPLLVQQIEMELEAQFFRVRDAGVMLDHVDGHRYIHVVPAVFEITQKLAERFGCPWMRRPDEPLGPLGAWRPGKGLWRRCGNFPKRWVLTRLSRSNWRRSVYTRSSSEFHGVLDSGGMRASVLNSLLRSITPGVTEFVTHPGTPQAPVDSVWSVDDRGFLNSMDREAERHALVAGELRAVCDQMGVLLTSFAAIPAKGPLVGGTPRCSVKEHVICAAPNWRTGATPRS